MLLSSTSASGPHCLCAAGLSGTCTQADVDLWELFCKSAHAIRHLNRVCSSYVLDGCLLPAGHVGRWQIVKSLPSFSQSTKVRVCLLPSELNKPLGKHMVLQLPPPLTPSTELSSAPGCQVLKCTLVLPTYCPSLPAVLGEDGLKTIET